jgi:hypothetical protein
LTLKAQTDLALERFKSEQQLRAAEHQVRFSRLHETRAELIAAFYKAVVEFERYFRVHAHPVNQLLTSDEGGKHSKAIGALYGNLETLYSDNRVFFNVDTCRLVDSLLEALVSVRDLNIAVPIRDSRDGSPMEAIRIPSWTGISAKITPVKADLEGITTRSSRRRFAAWLNSGYKGFPIKVKQISNRDASRSDGSRNAFRLT